jgi:hypothetical protein
VVSISLVIVGVAEPRPHPACVAQRDGIEQRRAIQRGHLVQPSRINHRQNIAHCIPVRQAPRVAVHGNSITLVIKL